MDKEFEGFEEFYEDDTYETVVMTDENGIETDFVVIDAITVSKVRYLLVVEAESIDDEESEATILKETFTNDNEAVYSLVEDDAEFNKISILLQDNDNDYEMKF